MSCRVVITGVGPVTLGGTGVEKFSACIFSGKPVKPSMIPAVFERHHKFRSRFYLPLPDINLASHGIAMPEVAIMQPEDRMSVLAARLAFEDAGMTMEKVGNGFIIPSLPQCDTLIGIGITGLEPVFTSWLAHIGIRELDTAVMPPARIKYNRMIVPQIMANSPAAWVSVVFGLKGASHTVNASCASGTIAVGEAFRRIRDGYANAVLCGGAENLHESTGAIMRGFDILGTLTQSADGQCLPFSRRHDGFVFAEGGACLLVLEELEHAKTRNARIYAELADFQANSDAYNIVQMESSGKQVKELLSRLKANRPIDYYNSHGTGTILNDTVEAEALSHVFQNGKGMPRMNSTKALVGHTLGASGAIAAAVTALSIFHQKIHGMPVIDPMDGLPLVSATQNAAITSAISASFGFGGHNAGVVLKRYQNE